MWPKRVPYAWTDNQIYKELITIYGRQKPHRGSKLARGITLGHRREKKRKMVQKKYVTELCEVNLFISHHKKLYNIMLPLLIK